jgi:hypothetical protein
MAEFSGKRTSGDRAWDFSFAPHSGHLAAIASLLKADGASVTPFRLRWVVKH